MEYNEKNNKLLTAILIWIEFLMFNMVLYYMMPEYTLPLFIFFMLITASAIYFSYKEDRYKKKG